MPAADRLNPQRLLDSAITAALNADVPFRDVQDFAVTLTLPVATTAAEMASTVTLLSRCQLELSRWGGLRSHARRWRLSSYSLPCPTHRFV
jgi:hypothetical protein